MTGRSLILLVLLVLLIILYCALVRRRMKREHQQRRAEHEREWAGRGFDAATVAPQLQQVRRNHAAAAHERLRSVDHKPGLFETACRAISRLAFFRSQREEQKE